MTTKKSGRPLVTNLVDEVVVMRHPHLWPEGFGTSLDPGRKVAKVRAAWVNELGVVEILIQDYNDGRMIQVEATTVGVAQRS